MKLQTVCVLYLFSVDLYETSDIDLAEKLTIALFGQFFLIRVLRKSLLRDTAVYLFEVCIAS